MLVLCISLSEEEEEYTLLFFYMCVQAKTWCWASVVFDESVTGVSFLLLEICLVTVN